MTEPGFSWSDIRKGMDYPMLIAVLLLFCLGILAIFSAGHGTGRTTAPYAYKQVIWGAISLAAYVAILFQGYRRFLSWSYGIYGFAVAFLFVISQTGDAVRGARSWSNFGFASFQPAEFAKVALILALARFCYRCPPHTFKNLMYGLSLSGVSMLLVLLQPDLGTTLVFGAIMTAVLIVAGTPGKYVAGLAGIGLSFLPLAWSFLKPYQKNRLLVFLDPTVDPQGAGYNVIQSRIAVGSGGLLGKGFLHGTQSRLHFLPEPHTDFIFSVFSEEFGFAGGVLILLLFAFLFWRILSAALHAKDLRAKYLCVGVAAWIWFQVMESIAMSMGLAPVTGLPLPLISYGGSSLLMEAVALALVQSVAVASSAERVGGDSLWGTS